MRHEFDLSEETLQLLFAAKSPGLTMDEFFRSLLDALGVKAAQSTHPRPSSNINEMVRRFESYLEQEPTVGFVHQTGTMNVWEMPVRYRERRHSKKLFVGSTGAGLVYFPLTDLWLDPLQRERRNHWIARGVIPPQALKNGRFSGWRAYPRGYIRKNGDGLETAKDYFFQILDV